MFIKIVLIGLSRSINNIFIIYECLISIGRGCTDCLTDCVTGTTLLRTRIHTNVKFTLRKHFKFKFKQNLIWGARDHFQTFYTINSWIQKLFRTKKMCFLYTIFELTFHIEGSLNNHKGMNFILWYIAGISVSNVSTLYKIVCMLWIVRIEKLLSPCNMSQTPPSVTWDGALR